MANLRGRERDERERRERERDEAEVNSYLALLVAMRQGWGKCSAIEENN